MIQFIIATHAGYQHGFGRPRNHYCTPAEAQRLPRRMESAVRSGQTKVFIVEERSPRDHEKVCHQRDREAHLYFVFDENLSNHRYLLCRVQILRLATVLRTCCMIVSLWARAHALLENTAGDVCIGFYQLSVPMCICFWMQLVARMHDVVIV